MRSFHSRLSMLLRVSVVLTAVGTAFGFQSVPPGLVVYYKFDEAAGNSAADSGGGNFNGTWTNVTVGAVTCVAASAAGDCAPNVTGNTRSIVFTKPAAVTTDGGYVNVPTDPSFSFAGPFTAMAWIKPSAFNAGDNPNDTGAIIQKWDWTGVETNGYGMNRDLSGTISFWMGKAAMGDTILTTKTTTPLGEWSHVAIVFTGTGREIYINGALSASDTYVTIGASTAPLHIGKDDWARNFYGNVDEVRLYGRALSGGEVQSVFAGGDTLIGVGNPGPVVPQPGLLGTYWSYPNGSPTPPGTVPGSPDTTPATQTGTAQFLQRIEPNMFVDFVATPLPGNPNGTNYFMSVWEGFIVIPTTGSYTFYVSSDDGERTWLGNVTSATPTLDHWTQRGVVTDTTAAATQNAGKLPVRIEYEQGNGGASLRVEWSGPPGAQALIPGYALLPPDGPAAPTGLTATGSTNSSTASVAVSWNASTTPVAAANYILSRATAAAGPYTQVAVQPGLTFTDMGVAFGTTYYYIVQGVDASGYLVGPPSAPSAGATPVLPPISLTNPGPITTSEAGVNVTISLNVNVVPTSPVTVTISTSNQIGALLGVGAATPTASIQIVIPSGTAINTQFPFTVYGVDDFIANDPQTYTINFVVAGGGYTNPTITPVQGTNLEADTAGIIANPAAGLATNTNGGQATFTVQLNSKPVNPVSISVTSSNPTEGTVSIATLNFTGGPTSNWNVPQTVTVTGQGINLTYINEPYTVNLAVNAGSDASYVGLSATVSLVNIHLEIPPALPHVWNGSGSGGGCGLTGAEVGLVLVLAAVLRRRRTSSRYPNPS